MATLQWDHAVQFVNQPEAAIEIFAGQQLRAVAGGRHPGWGTRNALSYFGLTYIEFLAIADPDELRAATDKFLLSRDAARLLPENEALFRVALRSDDIDATHDQLRRTGVTVSPIVGWPAQRSAGQYHPLAESSPSMATLPGWSIPLCCSGEKTTPPG
ncbi:Uncharacterised protein [Klebsiella pneumoniae]|nr:Uncharacterised protein [Klebsiella pneumoniae]